MKYFNKILIILLVLSAFTLIFCGCGDENKVPGETELIAAGNSLKTALPKFVNLTDNYMYKEAIHQTNGEDWFLFSLVKLDNSDIFVREKRFNFNAGWQYEDTIFTDFEDLTDKDYAVYLKQNDNNYHMYKKYKYNDTDEEFVKYYYTDDSKYSINEKAEAKIYDYSFFKEEYFEYYETTNDSQDTVPCWKIKDSLLNDAAFKTEMGGGVKQFGEEARLDYVYLFLSDNKAASLQYGFYSHITSNVDMIFHNKIYFYYDNYQFDAESLSQGFDLYIND